MDQPAYYEIQVEGTIGTRWAEWFHGMNIAGVEDSGGHRVTILTGTIPDQSALLGMLQSIHNLGLLILSFKRGCQL
jgi:hypothetical protein